jgi:hypothetical protein
MKLVRSPEVTLCHAIGSLTLIPPCCTKPGRKPTCSCGTSPAHLLLIDKHHGRASEGKNELSEYPKIHPHLRWALGGVVMLIRRYCYVGEASQLSDPGLDKRKLLLTLPVALTDVADSWFLIVGVPESAT